MTDQLLRVADEYLKEIIVMEPGSRLHRLVARLCDTYYDDLTDERIEQVERLVDTLRLTHADGLSLALPAPEADV